MAKRENKERKDYVAEMARIIKTEQKNGLVGLRFCYLPTSSGRSTESICQAMAKGFCDLETMDKNGYLTVV